MEFKQPLWEGLVIPVAGALLGLVPTALARLSPLRTREALDGFLIGMGAALCFTAAATLTRLGPQFQTGLTADGLPVRVLLMGALIRGLLMSLIAATAGAMFGTTLWFTKPDPAHQHPGQALAGPFPALGVIVIAAAVLGLVDASPAQQNAELVVYLAVAVVMLVCLRVVLHMALLREEHGPSTLEPLLCEHCGHVVPDMAFCPACGVATQASSQSSRTARRGSRPVRVDSPPERS
jgi:RsiW-degrading membrane proteinase PrsW (M82 family)